MADPTTTRLGIPYPVGTDLVSSGPAEMQAIAAAVDTAWGLEYGDIIGPGVVGNATIINASGPAINSATGALTYTLNADVAWVNVSGTLTRCSLPTSGTTITPSPLPSNGFFRCIGLFLTPPALWGGTGTLSLVSGSASGSSSGAPLPATPSGTLLLQTTTIGLSGATYSIAIIFDRRVLARTAQAASWGGWVALTMGTNMALASGKTVTPSIRWDGPGLVRLKGSVQYSGGGGSSLTVATAPTAFATVVDTIGPLGGAGGVFVTNAAAFVSGAGIVTNQVFLLDGITYSTS